MTIIASRDQYSEVLDERRRWRPDWYQWISQLERSVYLNKSLQAGVANVINHGADPTGKGDNYDIIQSTWNKYGLIYMPRGTYRTSTTLLCPAIVGAGIIGDGSTSTTILGDFDSADVIQSRDVFGVQFQGLNITRPTTATSGVGLNMNPTGVNQDGALLYDLHLTKHNIGIQMLSFGGWSRAQFIRSESNSGDGFRLSGQWQIQDTFSALNGSNGYTIVPPIGGDVAGQWRGMSSYGNGNTGIAFFGSSGNALERIRIMDSMFVGDASTEMYFDSYCLYPIVLTNVQAITPLAGTGILVTANNTSMHLNGCVAIGPNSSGNAVFWDGAGTLFIHGGQFSGGSGGNGLIGTRGSASIHGATFSTLGGASLSLFSPMVNTTVVGCQAFGAGFVQGGTGLNYAAGNF